MRDGSLVTGKDTLADTLAGGGGGGRRRRKWTRKRMGGGGRGAWKGRGEGDGVDVHKAGKGVGGVSGGGGNSSCLKGATPGPRKQTSAGQGLINISVTTETGESWEGRCAGVSSNAE